MKLLEKIREMYARLAELSRAELSELSDLITRSWTELDEADATPENVDAINELVGYTEGVLGRTEALDAADAKSAADKEAAREKIAQLKAGDPDNEGDTPVETDAPAADDTEVVADDKVAVTASQMRSALPTPTPTGAPSGTSIRPTLLASGNVGSKLAKEKFEDKFELAEAIADTLRSLHNNRQIVASAKWLDQYPEANRLRKGAERENFRKVEAAVAPSKSLLASGGTPLPVNVDYSMNVWATDARPFRDYLQKFGADHGGLTFRTPPTLASVASGVTTWTEATDTTPGGSVKNVYTVPVQSPTTVYVDAIVQRAQFGNFMGQFDPDTIAANTELLMASAARTAEIALLTKLQAACTADITSARVLGASRDWLVTIDRVAANFRYTNRLDSNAVLSVVLPDYVKNMIRADRAYEIGHDGQSIDPLAITDAWIENALAVRNIEACWTLDALPVNGSVYPAQGFAGFTASAAAPDFPTSIVWNMFPKNALQFLDGGVLNLGVVRDAVLDSTNDYEIFSEVFEGLASRVFAGGALQIVSALHIDGATGATVAVS